MTTKITLDIVEGEVLDRSNHTGVQPISSVTGLQDELDNLAPVTGSWSPTLTVINNISAFSIVTSYFFRVGNMVHCFGAISITPVAAADTSTSFDLTLPVPTDIIGSGDLRGVYSTLAAQRAGAVFGEATNNVARFIVASERTVATTFSYSFDYIVQ